MITRKYFISGTVAHNNNTGMYSFYNGVMSIVSWLKPSGEDVVIAAREMIYEQMAMELEKHNVGDVTSVELNHLSRL